MTEIFIDSFFWIAALNPRDPYHVPVLQMPKPPRGVSTRAIQLEVMDALSSPRLRGPALQFWQETNKDPDLLIIPLDDQLLFRAVIWFEKHKDKAWSLTDCISFEVMSERGITTALTGDHHFEQAGFQIVLK